MVFRVLLDINDSSGPIAERRRVGRQLLVQVFGLHLFPPRLLVYYVLVLLPLGCGLLHLLLQGGCVGPRSL